jgi:hypothetical protein
LLLCADPLVAHGQPLTSSDFQLDLYQGPALGSTRVVGLGGAYAAVAEESVGIPFNPASVANRTYYSNDRFDWDLGLDFLLPGLFQPDDFDFDNNGSSTSADFVVWSLGGQVQYKSFGIGVYGRGQTFEVTEQTEQQDPRQFTIGLWLNQLSLGYALFDHQLIVGGGLRIGLFAVTEKGKSKALFQQAAAGGEAGALFCPHRWPVRLAASFSSPLSSDTSTECEEDQCPQGFIMPRGVGLPWEVRIGASYRWGSTPFNRAPLFLREKPAPIVPPEAYQPPEALPAPPITEYKGGLAPSPYTRTTAKPVAKPSEPQVDLEKEYRGGPYLLVVAELHLTGSVEDAIGTDGFLEQQRERAGEQVSLSPRLGLETEILRRRLRARAGSYWEPSRFTNASGRIHGTFSFDLRLFDFSLWGERSLRFSSALDLASRYSNLSLSLGFWH